jgi:hypothetical protein
MPHVDRSYRSAEAIGEGARPDAFVELWAAFREHLATRIREINDEVTHYPRPIARCDVQLSKLLEERARVYQQMNLAAELGPKPPGDGDAHWLQRLDDYLAKLEPCGADDDGEAVLRSRLLRWMAEIRG